MSQFNRIQFENKTVIAVYVFVKVTEGNHIKSTRNYRSTLITDKMEEIEITENQYNQFILGSGIRRFFGCLETGGGRHNFRGQDISDAREWVKANL